MNHPPFWKGLPYLKQTSGLLFVGAAIFWQDLGAQYNRELFVVSVIGIQSSVPENPVWAGKFHGSLWSFVGKIWSRNWLQLGVLGYQLEPKSPMATKQWSLKKNHWRRDHVLSIIFLVFFGGYPIDWYFFWSSSLGVFRVFLGWGEKHVDELPLRLWFCHFGWAVYSRPIIQPIAIIDVIDETYVACASGLWCDWEAFTVPSWSVSKGRASGRLLRCIPYTFSERQTRPHNKGGQSSPRTFENEFLILKECLSSSWRTPKIVRAFKWPCQTASNQRREIRPSCKRN